MKKVFVLGALVVGLFGLTTDMSAKAAPGPKPEKIEQIVTLHCCDGSGVVRCILGNYTPVGNACYCYGQGWGYAC